MAGIRIQIQIAVAYVCLYSRVISASSADRTMSDAIYEPVNDVIGGRSFNVFRFLGNMQMKPNLGKYELRSL